MEKAEFDRDPHGSGILKGTAGGNGRCKDPGARRDGGETSVTGMTTSQEGTSASEREGRCLERLSLRMGTF